MSGAITVNQSIDRETRGTYFLFVEANDGVFSSYAEVTITLADVNEHKPFFIQHEYNVTIAETHSPRYPIVKMLTDDQVRPKMNRGTIGQGNYGQGKIGQGKIGQGKMAKEK